MILSISRRTDIPNYYSDWFYNRIKDGFLYVKNPMNPHQISRIALSRDLVDCIVFWTKNPEPMIARLHELEGYAYYFQFTLTGYGRDIEPNVPHKKKHMIPVFQRLSDRIGSSRVVWRYDPILFNDTYTEAYHIQAFGQIAEALSGYTKRCVISFVDTYAKNRAAMRALGIRQDVSCGWESSNGQAKNDVCKASGNSLDGLKIFVGKLAYMARQYGMEITSCAEELDLSDCGIGHSSCIDRILIEEITGYAMEAGKDKNQRASCGCVESIEVGAYHTCLNGCKYCYANISQEQVQKNYMAFDADSPLLCGRIVDGDRVTDRKTRSLRKGQMEITFI